MSKLNCWRLTISSLLFGISDRLINSITKDYSVDSTLQVILGLVLLTLVCQLYPYNLGD
jgi:hypothetical protein